MTTINIALKDAYALAFEVLRSNGFSQPHADAIARNLDTADLPPLDLLIRTSGEIRLSNFLLWQSAYAEMLFIDTLWPDFTPEHLAKALDDFAQRERRFGGRK